MTGERIVLLALPFVSAGVVALFFNLDSVVDVSDSGSRFKPVAFEPNEPTVNPVVLRFDSDLAKINSDITNDLERLRDIMDLRGTGDVGCLNAIERDIIDLQNDLHRKYQEYLNAVNEQGGVISEAQDYYYRKEIDKIHAQIKAKLVAAEQVALRVNGGYCT